MRLIDADALVNEFNEAQVEFDEYYKGLGRAKVITDNAPTVEPFEPDYVGAERLAARQRGYADGYHNGMEIGKTLNPRIKQGEWIKITKDGIAPIEYRCNICGRTIQSYYDEYIITKDFPFCHCGADMRGGNTSD